MAEQKTTTAKDEKTTAVLGTVNNAITSIFGLFSSNSNRKLEEEKTRQLQVQLEGEQDADLQELLRKKLDVQIAAMNAAVESDKRKSRVVLVISLIVGALAALVITLAFKKKTKEIPNNQPIFIASGADFPQSNTS